MSVVDIEWIVCGLKLRVESKMTPRFLTYGDYGIIVSLQMMGEGVDGREFLYGRCRNRASVFHVLNASELLDRHLCIVSIAEDIMFWDSLGLSLHDRYSCM